MYIYIHVQDNLNNKSTILTHLKMQNYIYK